MKQTLTLYRVLSAMVGVAIVILVLFAWPLDKLHILDESWFPEGSNEQQLGAFITATLGTAHGFVYMVFVFVAFILSRQARWSFGFTLGTLISGTVPFLSFWSERRAVADVRAKLGESG